MQKKEIAIPEVVDDIEKLPVLNFGKQYMNNSKISRIISTKDIPIGEQIKEIKILMQDSIINLVNIWADPCITLSQQVTQFDMAVMDAAYTIMCSGQMILTAEWIAKVLSGNTKQKVTQQKLVVIRKSIDKLRYIHIKIDCKDEMNTRRDTKDKIKKYVYESYLLPLDKIEAIYQSNGTEIIAYPVLRKPALYTYAELVQQIINVPAELLDTQKYYSDTDDAILIKRYVIKRVAQILNKKNKMHSNKISYLWYENKEAQGLYAELGYIPDDNDDIWRKKTKFMINKIVKSTLLSLKDKKIINDFEEYRTSGTKNPASPVMGYQVYIGKQVKNR
ncbi:hypothetical protein [Anaerocolumna xylanovorans]|uniref:Uncharacterized protein n=1 Tax=Anaerocolumna xylanovorans DSM 12503 TaxID=1121345 RepID=A0A1M7YL99_9FIRM|nr:hypothetical protein [Anaerocolumna xylanovorans]SHO53403.1 hypothetical protein SAMN02745217_04107 [Anaerocolumna xylanovorans DSM 12503]